MYCSVLLLDEKLQTLLKRTYSKWEENIQFMGKLDVQVLLI